MTAEIKNPRYEEIDLGRFDKEYTGQMVRVLVNPSRAFRAGYNAACAGAVFGVDDKAFVEHLAAVLDMPEDKAGEYVNSLPPDAAQWLFFYTIDDFNGEKFETAIKPHLYRVWDDWVIKRVKAHALPVARSESSATKPSSEQDDAQNPST